ncbi:MAG: GTPase, partial [Rhodospirillales bacterium]
RGERLREGIHIAIVGAPNTGKSSLLNLLAQRDAAIVSEIAGTTRDVVEVSLDLGGWPVTLADTAGLRDSDDAIEREGVRRARLRADHADLRLGVLDAGNPQSMAALYGVVGSEDLLLLNKRDLVGATPDWAPPTAQAVSIKTGQGVDALLGELETRVAVMLQSAAPTPTRARHRAAVRDCVDALRRALQQDETELLGEDLRLAARSLGRITGRVEVEDILDAVFGEFCIGK